MAAPAAAVAAAADAAAPERPLPGRRGPRVGPPRPLEERVQLAFRSWTDDASRALIAQHFLDHRELWHADVEGVAEPDGAAEAAAAGAAGEAAKAAGDVGETASAPPLSPEVQAAYIRKWVGSYTGPAFSFRLLPPPEIEAGGLAPKTAAQLAADFAAAAAEFDQNDLRVVRNTLAFWETAGIVERVCGAPVAEVQAASLPHLSNIRLRKLSDGKSVGMLPDFRLLHRMTETAVRAEETGGEAAAGAAGEVAGDAAGADAAAAGGAGPGRRGRKSTARSRRLDEAALSATIGKGRFFASLMVRQPQIQVPLAPACRPLTAFWTPQGVFQFTVLHKFFRGAAEAAGNFVADLAGEVALPHHRQLLVAAATREELAQRVRAVLDRCAALHAGLILHRTVVTEKELHLPHATIAFGRLKPDTRIAIRRINAVLATPPEDQVPLRSLQAALAAAQPFLRGMPAGGSRWDSLTRWVQQRVRGAGSAAALSNSGESGGAADAGGGAPGDADAAADASAATGAATGAASGTAGAANAASGGPAGIGASGGSGSAVIDRRTRRELAALRHDLARCLLSTNRGAARCTALVTSDGKTFTAVLYAADELAEERNADAAAAAAAAADAAAAAATDEEAQPAAGEPGAPAATKEAPPSGDASARSPRSHPRVPPLHCYSAPLRRPAAAAAAAAGRARPPRPARPLQVLGRFVRAARAAGFAQPIDVEFRALAGPRIAIDSPPITAWNEKFAPETVAIVAVSHAPPRRRLRRQRARDAGAAADAAGAGVAPGTAAEAADGSAPISPLKPRRYAGRRRFANGGAGREKRSAAPASPAAPAPLVAAAAN